MAQGSLDDAHKSSEQQVNPGPGATMRAATLVEGVRHSVRNGDGRDGHEVHGLPDTLATRAWEV